MMIEFIVHAGLGLNGPARFETEDEALAYAKAEAAIPSYMGEGRKRHVRVVRREVIVDTIWQHP